MPLSEQERRALEELEAQLSAEDPKFASAMQADPERRRRRNEARIRAALSRLLAGPPGAGLTVAMLAREAGVPVTVVPGLSSSVAVPGLAQIPVTHRGVAHEFTVVSGHLPPGHPQSLVDWATIGRLRGTVVVLMGVETAPAIAAA